MTTEGGGAGHWESTTTTGPLNEASQTQHKKEQKYHRYTTSIKKF